MLAPFAGPSAAMVAATPHLCLMRLQLAYIASLCVVACRQVAMDVPQLVTSAASPQAPLVASLVVQYTQVSFAAFLIQPGTNPFCVGCTAGSMRQDYTPACLPAAICHKALSR